MEEEAKASRIVLPQSQIAAKSSPVNRLVQASQTSLVPLVSFLLTHYDAYFETLPRLCVYGHKRLLIG